MLGSRWCFKIGLPFFPLIRRIAFTALATLSLWGWHLSFWKFSCCCEYIRSDEIVESISVYLRLHTREAIRVLLLEAAPKVKSLKLLLLRIFLQEVNDSEPIIDKGVFTRLFLNELLYSRSFASVFIFILIAWDILTEHVCIISRFRIIRGLRKQLLLLIIRI